MTYVTLDCLAYALPFLPLVTRGVLIAKFPAVRDEILNEDEQQRGIYRTHLLTFVAISAAALAALAVADAALRSGLQWALYYLSISFFSWMCALQYVAYKAKRWEDQIVDALNDVGMLSFFSAVVAVLVATHTAIAPIIAGIAVFVWALDHAYRIYLDWTHHRKLTENIDQREHEMSKDKKDQGLIPLPDSLQKVPLDPLRKFPAEYVTCPKHGTTYPRGSACPDCANE